MSSHERQSLADIRLWSPQVEDSAHLAMGAWLDDLYCSKLKEPAALLNCIRAIGGFTNPRSPNTVFDTDSFKESEYLSRIPQMSGNAPVVMNWYVVPFPSVLGTDSSYRIGIIPSRCASQSSSRASPTSILSLLACFVWGSWKRQPISAFLSMRLETSIQSIH
jgi:hypothetical protein